jgi:hypothetical protein
VCFGKGLINRGLQRRSNESSKNAFRKNCELKYTLGSRFVSTANFP